MSSETGIEEDMLKIMLKKLSPKIVYMDGWIGIKNFPKYQAENEKIKIGIINAIKEIPQEIKIKMDRVWIGYDRVSIAPELSKYKYKLKSKLKLKLSSPSFEGVKDVVNYFFELKGWANKEKSFYKENDVRYGHHARRAKELLELCEGNVSEAKECIRKMSEWASSKKLTWMIETIFKHWYDIDSLKPAEKKPHYDGCRIFQKVEGGKWYIVRAGEIKELGLWPKKEEIIWR